MCPSAAFTHTTITCPVLSFPQVRKICSPHKTGDECPPPGSWVFQLMSLSDHWAGMSAFPNPVPPGPRKRVHSWADAAVTKQPRMVSHVRCRHPHIYLSVS